MAFIATPESIAALGLTRVRPRTLGEKHFWMMIGIAAIVHFFILLGVQYWPASDVREVKVRTMNIKLGGGQAISKAPIAEIKSLPADVPAQKTSKTVAAKAIAAPIPKTKPAPPAPKVTPKIAPKAVPKQEPFAAPVVPVKTQSLIAPKRVEIDQMVRQRPAQNPIPANVKSNVHIDPSMLGRDNGLQALPQLATLSQKPAAPAPVSAQPSKPATGIAVQPQQHVRELPAPSQQTTQAAPIPDGTPEAQAIRARYEQVVSQWLETHKTYPAAAKMLGQQGQPVLRIRMDRAGNVKFSSVDKSSGYRLLDDAAMDMARRANPFPRPPANYPGDKLVEFLIPVAFKIN